MSARAVTKAQRKARQAEKKRQQLIIRGLVGLIVLGVIVGIAYWVWLSMQPLVGSEEWTAIPTQEPVHIETGVEYEPYNTNPPTSGAHYGDPMQPATAGFYEAARPDENLVHSLEHGYVIIWYDCAQVTEQECEDIQTGLKQVIDATASYKIIVMPRENMEAPIIATSWGMMYKQETLDRDKLVAFVKANREKSPEPGAQ